MGEHAAGDHIREQLLHLPSALLLGEFLQERVLPPPEYLDALEGEVLVEAPQLQTGPVDLRYRDLADEPGASADALQVKGVIFPQVELQQVEDQESFLGALRHLSPPTLLPR